MKPIYRRLIASVFLLLFSWSTVTAIGLGAVGLLIPEPAWAQCPPGISGWAEACGGGGGGGGGGLGGLFGGGQGGMLLFLLLLLQLLQQLFQGGGGGAQGPGEEQPPARAPSVGPTKVGAPSRSSAVGPPTLPGSVTLSPFDFGLGGAPTPGGTSTPLASEPACVFKVSATAITTAPSSCTLRLGQFLRIINTDTVNHTIYNNPHDPARTTPGEVTAACGTLTPNELCRVFPKDRGTIGFHVHDNPTLHATATVQ